MPELFSADWAHKYKDLWNKNEELVNQLGNSDFNSVVAFGVDGEESPRVVLTVSKGLIVSAGTPTGESLNWDLRASPKEWDALVNKPPGLMKLGLAYTSRKLKFHKGDYAVMIKDPSLSTAFVKCFALMGQALK